MDIAWQWLSPSTGGVAATTASSRRRDRPVYDVVHDPVYVAQGDEDDGGDNWNTAGASMDSRDLIKMASSPEEEEELDHNEEEVYYTDDGGYQTDEIMPTFLEDRVLNCMANSGGAFSKIIDVIDMPPGLEADGIETDNSGERDVVRHYPASGDESQVSHADAKIERIRSYMKRLEKRETIKAPSPEPPLVETLSQSSPPDEEPTVVAIDCSQSHQSEEITTIDFPDPRTPITHATSGSETDSADPPPVSTSRAANDGKPPLAPQFLQDAVTTIRRIPSLLPKSNRNKKKKPPPVKIRPDSFLSRNRSRLISGRAEESQPSISNHSTIPSVDMNQPTDEERVEVVFVEEALENKDDKFQFGEPEGLVFAPHVERVVPMPPAEEKPSVSLNRRSSIMDNMTTDESSAANRQDDSDHDQKSSTHRRPQLEPIQTQTQTQAQTQSKTPTPDQVGQQENPIDLVEIEAEEVVMPSSLPPLRSPVRSPLRSPMRKRPRFRIRRRARPQDFSPKMEMGVEYNTPESKKHVVTSPATKQRQASKHDDTSNMTSPRHKSGVKAGTGRSEKRRASKHDNTTTNISSPHRSVVKTESPRSQHSMTDGMTSTAREVAKRRNEYRVTELVKVEVDDSNFGFSPSDSHRGERLTLAEDIEPTLGDIIEVLSSDCGECVFASSPSLLQTSAKPDGIGMTSADLNRAQKKNMTCCALGHPRVVTGDSLPNAPTRSKSTFVEDVEPTLEDIPCCPIDATPAPIAMRPTLAERIEPTLDDIPCCPFSPNDEHNNKGHDEYVRAHEIIDVEAIGYGPGSNSMHTNGTFDCDPSSHGARGYQKGLPPLTLAERIEPTLEDIPCCQLGSRVQSEVINHPDPESVPEKPKTKVRRQTMRGPSDGPPISVIHCELDDLDPDPSSQNFLRAPRKTDLPIATHSGTPIKTEASIINVEDSGIVDSSMPRHPVTPVVGSFWEPPPECTSTPWSQTPENFDTGQWKYKYRIKPPQNDGFGGRTTAVRSSSRHSPDPPGDPPGVSAPPKGVLKVSSGEVRGVSLKESTVGAGNLASSSGVKKSIGNVRFGRTKDDKSAQGQYHRSTSVQRSVSTPEKRRESFHFGSAIMGLDKIAQRLKTDLGISSPPRPRVGRAFSRDRGRRSHHPSPLYEIRASGMPARPVSIRDKVASVRMGRRNHTSHRYVKPGFRPRDLRSRIHVEPTSSRPVTEAYYSHRQRNGNSRHGMKTEQSRPNFAKIGLQHERRSTPLRRVSVREESAPVGPSERDWPSMDSPPSEESMDSFDGNPPTPLDPFGQELNRMKEKARSVATGGARASTTFRGDRASYSLGPSKLSQLRESVNADRKKLLSRFSYLLPEKDVLGSQADNECSLETSIMRQTQAAASQSGVMMFRPNINVYHGRTTINPRYGVTGIESEAESPLSIENIENPENSHDESREDVQEDRSSRDEREDVYSRRKRDASRTRRQPTVPARQSGPHASSVVSNGHQHDTEHLYQKLMGEGSPSKVPTKPRIIQVGKQEPEIIQVEETLDGSIYQTHGEENQAKVKTVDPTMTKKDSIFGNASATLNNMSHQTNTWGMEKGTPEEQGVVRDREVIHLEGFDEDVQLNLSYSWKNGTATTPNVMIGSSQDLKTHFEAADAKLAAALNGEVNIDKSQQIEYLHDDDDGLDEEIKNLQVSEELLRQELELVQKRVALRRKRLQPYHNGHDETARKLDMMDKNHWTQPHSQGSREKQGGALSLEAEKYPNSNLVGKAGNLHHGECANSLFANVEETPEASARRFDKGPHKPWSPASGESKETFKVNNESNQQSQLTPHVTFVEDTSYPAVFTFEDPGDIFRKAQQRPAATISPQGSLSPIEQAKPNSVKETPRTKQLNESTSQDENEESYALEANQVKQEVGPATVADSTYGNLFEESSPSRMPSEMDDSKFQVMHHHDEEVVEVCVGESDSAEYTELEDIEIVFVEQSFAATDVFTYGEKGGIVFDWVRDDRSFFKELSNEAKTRLKRNWKNGPVEIISVLSLEEKSSDIGPLSPGSATFQKVTIETQNLDSRHNDGRRRIVPPSDRKSDGLKKAVDLTLPSLNHQAGTEIKPKDDDDSQPRSTLLQNSKQVEDYFWVKSPPPSSPLQKQEYPNCSKDPPHSHHDSAQSPLVRAHRTRSIPAAAADSSANKPEYADSGHTEDPQTTSPTTNNRFRQPLEIISVLSDPPQDELNDGAGKGIWRQPWGNQVRCSGLDPESLRQEDEAAVRLKSSSSQDLPKRISRNERKKSGLHSVDATSILASLSQSSKGVSPAASMYNTTSQAPSPKKKKNSTTVVPKNDDKRTNNALQLDSPKSPNASKATLLHNTSPEAKSPSLCRRDASFSPTRQISLSETTPVTACSNALKTDAQFASKDTSAEGAGLEETVNNLFAILEDSEASRSSSSGPIVPITKHRSCGTPDNSTRKGEESRPQKLKKKNTSASQRSRPTLIFEPDKQENLDEVQANKQATRAANLSPLIGDQADAAVDSTSESTSTILSPEVLALVKRAKDQERRRRDSDSTLTFNLPDDIGSGNVRQENLCDGHESNMQNDESTMESSSETSTNFPPKVLAAIEKAKESLVAQDSRSTLTFDVPDEITQEKKAEVNGDHREHIHISSTSLEDEERLESDHSSSHSPPGPGVLAIVERARLLAADSRQETRSTLTFTLPQEIEEEKAQPEEAGLSLPPNPPVQEETQKKKSKNNKKGTGRKKARPDNASLLNMTIACAGSMDDDSNSTLTGAFPNTMIRSSRKKKSQATGHGHWLNSSENAAGAILPLAAILPATGVEAKKGIWDQKHHTFALSEGEGDSPSWGAEDKGKSPESHFSAAGDGFFSMLRSGGRLLAASFSQRIDVISMSDVDTMSDDGGWSVGGEASNEEYDMDEVAQEWITQPPKELFLKIESTTVPCSEVRLLKREVKPAAVTNPISSPTSQASATKGESPTRRRLSKLKKLLDRKTGRKKHSETHYQNDDKPRSKPLTQGAHVPGFVKLPKAALSSLRQAPSRGEERSEIDEPTPSKTTRAARLRVARRRLGMASEASEAGDTSTSVRKKHLKSNLNLQSRIASIEKYLDHSPEPRVEADKDKKTIPVSPRLIPRSSSLSRSLTNNKLSAPPGSLHCAETAEDKLKGQTSDSAELQPAITERVSADN